MMRLPGVEETLTLLRLRRHRLTRHARTFSHSSLAERLALYQAARSLPAGARALEIGSHLGSSARFICAGLEHGGGHLVCVDTWMNQTMPDGEKDTFEEFKANTREFAHMITTMRKFSSDLTPDEIGGPLSLVFIDGDHSEAAVRGDFSLVTAWLGRGGLVGFHDVRAEFPGVHVVLGEALASGKWRLLRLVDSLCFIMRT